MSSTNMRSPFHTTNQSLEFGTKDEKRKIHASCPELMADIRHVMSACSAFVSPFVLVVYFKLDRYPIPSHPTNAFN